MPRSLQKRERFGWYMYDWANSAFATIILASVFPVYFLTLVPGGAATFDLFGKSHSVPASSLWGYTVSVSMLLIAMVAPQLGKVADHLNRRRAFLTFFCLLGVVATALLALPGRGDYLAAALLFITANICFSGGNIFYNAFLPLIGSEDEMDRISARGFASGYLGGGLALLIVFILISRHDLFGITDKAEATRAGIVMTSLWWGIFALPTLLFLRDPAPQGPRTSGRLSGGSYLKTFFEIRRYRDLCRFLVAFLLYNDGVQTIIIVSAVFAKETLALSQTNILACFLMIQFIAMPGTLLMGRLADRWGSKGLLQGALFIFILITACAFFITRSIEFWILAAAVGLVFGGTQAISRSLFGKLVPEEKTAEFFGFYAISAKFASIFGPFLFGLVTHLTGSLRYAILFLSVFFAAGLWLLRGVDVERGKLAASEGRS